MEIDPSEQKGLGQKDKGQKNGDGELLRIPVIKILLRDQIIAHQETSSDSLIVNVSDDNFVKIKQFGASQANHSHRVYAIVSLLTWQMSAFRK